MVSTVEAHRWDVWVPSVVEGLGLLPGRLARVDCKRVVGPVERLLGAGFLSFQLFNGPVAPPPVISGIGVRGAMVQKRD